MPRFPQYTFEWAGGLMAQGWQMKGIRGLPAGWRAVVLLLLLVLGGVEFLIVAAAWRERDQALDALEREARQATEAKAHEMSRMLADLYATTRTISLLPAVRRPAPQNRHSVADDVVDGRRFTEADARTVVQLYHRVAEVLSVSEIYVVYDGFAPERGEVPFLMFDSEIVERFRDLKQSLRLAGAEVGGASAVAEDEAAEYAEIVRELAYFKREHPVLPATAPRGVASLVSPPMITCDNSQFPSLTSGQERDRRGVLFSVPIYDDTTQQFKGLVTTVVRLNALEARLLDWPLIPVTPAERARSSELLAGHTPVDDVLSHARSRIEVYDRRNTTLAATLAGRAQEGLRLHRTLEAPASAGWELTRYLPRSAFDAVEATARQSIAGRSAIALAVLMAFAAIALLFLRQRHAAAELAELQERADYDPLTGLPNRRHLDRIIESGLEHAHSDGCKLALVMVDLDNFKTINDTYGHHVGDLLLTEVSRRFQKQLNASDPWPDGMTVAAGRSRARSIGRLGGDEFVVVLPRIEDEAAACAVSERLLSALAVPMLLEGRAVQVRASLGVALFPDHGRTAAQLLRNADQAMYAAKRIEESAVVTYQREADPAAVRRVRLTTDLRDALARDQFELHYQAVVNLQRLRVESAEVLLRWRHPELGVVSPGEFVPLLERSGLIVPVGLWVLRHACDQLRHWRQARSPIAGVAVNVSVVQLAQPDFSGQAIEVITASGVDPSSVTIEVTETVLMDNPERSIAQLEALRRAGVRIAIDDFGAGYSSLSYLRRLPVQVLKIDRMLLVDAVNPTGRAILQAMVDLARQLDLDCIAEGVETLEQYQLVRETGCYRLQGYLFSRPLPAVEADLMARRMNLEPLGACDLSLTDSVFARLQTPA
jgi:diguanylate cyclase (GGDEF)-like protein